MELFPLDDNPSALGASMSIVPDQDLLLLNTYMYFPTMTIITILFCPPRQRVFHEAKRREVLLILS